MSREILMRLDVAGISIASAIYKITGVPKLTSVSESAS